MLFLVPFLLRGRMSQDGAGWRRVGGGAAQGWRRVEWDRVGDGGWGGVRWGGVKGGVGVTQGQMVQGGLRRSRVQDHGMEGGEGWARIGWVGARQGAAGRGRARRDEAGRGGAGRGRARRGGSSGATRDRFFHPPSPVFPVPHP